MALGLEGTNASAAWSICWDILGREALYNSSRVKVSRRYTRMVVTKQNWFMKILQLIVIYIIIIIWTPSIIMLLIKDVSSGTTLLGLIPCVIYN